jgi:hypothetical protein
MRAGGKTVESDRRIFRRARKIANSDSELRHVCLSVCLSVWLSVCLSVCPSVSARSNLAATGLILMKFDF